MKPCEACAAGLGLGLAKLQGRQSKRMFPKKVNMKNQKKTMNEFFWT
jgi:hypothetical protein